MWTLRTQVPGYLYSALGTAIGTYIVSKLKVLHQPISQIAEGG